MKLVLSRKGFDSVAGGVPSPILEDGTMISLPIPERGATVTYDELKPRGYDLGAIVEDLTRGRLSRRTRVHLDPMIEPHSPNKRSHWVPAFGQAGAAQKHLSNQGVSVGDLFLFFGWFRRVERIRGNWRYCWRAPDLNMIFGWLKVGRVIDPSLQDPIAGLERHPHFDGTPRMHNCVYVASSAKNGGILPRYDSALQMTAPGKGRSVWRLPQWFYPKGREPLTYHGQRNRWRRNADYVLLKTVGRGQEFVLDTAQYPEAEGWVNDLLSHSQ